MKKTILIVLIVALFSSCKTVQTITPDNSGEITDTQAEVSEGVEAVASGAEAIADQAEDIAGAIGSLNCPGIDELKKQAEDHADATKKHAKETRALQESIKKARMEIVFLMARESQIDGLYREEKETRIKTEGQRNTLAVIVVGVLLAVAIWLFFKIKKILKPL